MLLSPPLSPGPFYTPTTTRFSNNHMFLLATHPFAPLQRCICVLAVMAGVLTSLKHKKEDIGSAPRGTECGLALRRFLDLEEGDVLRCYEARKIPRTIADL